MTIKLTSKAEEAKDKGLYATYSELMILKTHLKTLQDIHRDHEHEVPKRVIDHHLQQATIIVQRHQRFLGDVALDIMNSPIDSWEVR